jgi:hypothetical protein
MELWKRLPLEVRKELTSVLLTFGVAMATAILAWLEGVAPLSWATFWAVVATGARAGAKAVLLHVISWLKSRNA